MALTVAVCLRLANWCSSHLLNWRHRRRCIAYRAVSPSSPREKIMIAVESRLLEELRNCAVELRQLAYTLQNGIGEHDLLRLSERMRATADEVVRSGN
jgi:hypothetical protein